jgi:hypothetical protein
MTHVKEKRFSCGQMQNVLQVFEESDSPWRSPLRWLFRFALKNILYICQNISLARLCLTHYRTLQQSNISVLPHIPL